MPCLRRKSARIWHETESEIRVRIMEQSMYDKLVATSCPMSFKKVGNLAPSVAARQSHGGRNQGPCSMPLASQTRYGLCKPDCSILRCAMTSHSAGVRLFRHTPRAGPADSIRKGPSMQERTKCASQGQGRAQLHCWPYFARSLRVRYVYRGFQLCAIFLGPHFRGSSVCKWRHGLWQVLQSFYFFPSPLIAQTSTAIAFR